MGSAWSMQGALSTQLVSPWHLLALCGAKLVCMMIIHGMLAQVLSSGQRGTDSSSASLSIVCLGQACTAGEEGMHVICSASLLPWLAG